MRFMTGIYNLGLDIAWCTYLKDADLAFQAVLKHSGLFKCKNFLARRLVIGSSVKKSLPGDSAALRLLSRVDVVGPRFCT